MNPKTFSFRFDIDSLADIEVGLPRLLELAKELDVRFTFFVNMGRSFNWKTVVRSQRSQIKFRNPQSAIRTVKKLGLLRAIRTVVFNPDIGLSHKKTLFKLLDQGHELGLHGGMDHPLWQWELHSLSKVETDGLLKPAYDHFAGLFGKPKGFAAPGFNYNGYVLELVDEYCFEYASDMEGEIPFRPERLRHVQIPVNVIGPDKKPLIEHLWTSGLGEAEIKLKVKEEVGKSESAVIYGHPSFEGRFEGLPELLEWARVSGYLIAPMREIVRYNRCDE